MPQLGAFMVTKTGGWFARGIRWATGSKVNHAAVFVGFNFVVEAQPNGARLGLVSDYPDAIWSTVPASEKLQHEIAEAALDLVGTPYNFVDILAQFLVRKLHWKAPHWALKRISNPRRLQCAQLVDVAYERAGVKLFADGRPAGLVAPSDLLALIEGEHG